VAAAIYLSVSSTAAAGMHIPDAVRAACLGLREEVRHYVAVLVVKGDEARGADGSSRAAAHGAMDEEEGKPLDEESGEAKKLMRR
jgi:hypothetical protein